MEVTGVLAGNVELGGGTQRWGGDGTGGCGVDGGWVARGGH